MRKNQSSLVREIDALIKKRSILKHPFYQAWQMGALTRPMLQNYSRQYYSHVAAFPQYLSAVHSKMDNAQDRRLMLENLVDEEFGNKNHPLLWEQFAAALGVSKPSLEKTRLSRETRAFVTHFKKATQKGSVAEGIAALYVYESQIPRVSDEKIRGLKKFYGVRSKKGLEYFEVHKKADVEHSAAERTLIRKYTSKTEQKRVLKVVSATLDAYWNLLSGMERSFVAQ